MPYYYGYYGFDWTYLYLVLPCILLSLWASHNVNATFEKYSRQFNRRHLTGAEAARRVLQANGVHGVRIDRVSGKLTLGGYTLNAADGLAFCFEGGA